MIVNRVLNFGLYMLFSMMVGTGLVLAFRLPPRSGGLSLLGLTRHEWGGVHQWISYGFIFLVTVHLFVHRAWLMKVASKSHGWRLWGGLSMGVLIVVFLLLFPTAL